MNKRTGNALGTVGEAIIRRFWVYNPESSGVVQERFKQILGPGAQQRFQYKQGRFNNAIGQIRG